MRDMDKKRAHDRRRHKERMANDLRYRMRKVMNTINARCKSGKGRNDWRYYGGLEVSVTIDDLIELWHRDNAASLERPSIDRIDPSRGYVKDNLRFIEYMENFLRGQKKRLAEIRARKAA